MDLKNLNTFIQVAESGSFTRAAEQLGYSQPTISVQIKQLENELGIKLFDRIGHTVRLTDKGRDALSHAQNICRLFREMTTESSLDPDPRGLVRLAMADSLCAPLVGRGIDRFHTQYPHISIQITTAGTDELFRLLDHNEADMVCTLDTHIYNTNYIVAHEEKVGVHFVVPAHHPLADRDTVNIDDLLGEAFLLTERGMSYRRVLDERLAREYREILPILELGHADILCDLVAQGMGISLLPDYITQTAVDHGSVKRLHIPDYEPEIWKQLLYHRDKWVAPQMQAVMSYLSGSALLESPVDK